MICCTKQQEQGIVYRCLELPVGIAGTGTANPKSLIAALRLAAQMASAAA